ncbi:hypothetical protein [Candidatus Viridilinea mediisalina]|uniref:DUF5668 domain-containing protein n=1 Tax=Candidatus Viridilinea mediisalina TaxID=2024553 RepID=A0A2A6RJY7_9CHLR|nr:hypothetical protein [Candidatus Viridilinea mediisalina]PDW03263.1 hypothetical protein CJ255_09775 [Candidatus Viridilinea mediisalina]
MQSHVDQSNQYESQAEQSGNGQQQLIGGIILIVAGIILMLGQLFNLGVWVLLMLGVGFTAAGIATKHVGWFIPGGILNGIGLGVLLIESGIAGGEAIEGSIFLLAFALGWASISLFTRIFSPKALLWPLIPGGIMAFIGGALLLGEVGLGILSTLNYLWPLLLVIGGIIILVRSRRG